MIRRGSLVRDQPDPPSAAGLRVEATRQCDKRQRVLGGLAQLGEHLLCKQGVVGSIPSSSTTYCLYQNINSGVLILALPIASRKTYGCSLTIHRVESALPTERASWLTVPLATILIASQTNFILDEIHVIRAARLNYGITRQVKDLTVA